jgi:hypothetical protein
MAVILSVVAGEGKTAPARPPLLREEGCPDRAGAAEAAGEFPQRRRS